MDISQTAGMDGKKSTIESISKDELINKYKGLLGIAKQAKKAKDEFAEENQKLKDQLANYETQREADKKSLLTMKEMLEEFTKNKLEMTSEMSDLREKNKSLMEERARALNDMESLSIENEALRRQLNRLTEDNESLLTDIDSMEQQLKQVNVLGIEQKKHLDLLELEVEKLKEYEVNSKTLEMELQNLIQANESLQESYNTKLTESQSVADKYQSLKVINSEQRAKFNGLKERFVEVYKKLKQLQECKRILVESHHEYADSISRWQLEIMHASEQLCIHIRSLTDENVELKKDKQTTNGDVSIALSHVPVLIECCEKALLEYRQHNEVINELRRDNEELKNKIESWTGTADEVDHKWRNQKAFVDLRSQNKDLNAEISKTKQSSDEKVEVELVRNEIKKADSNKPIADEDVKLLLAEKEKLEKEIARITISSGEEVMRLRTENEKFNEQANTKLMLDEGIQLLKAENARLNDELSRIKSKLETEAAATEHNCVRTEITNLEEGVGTAKLATDKELDHLKTDNTRLKREATNTDESHSAEINRLKESNKSLKNELLAISEADNICVHHLPILIGCCERAVLEHRQQAVLIEELSNAGNKHTREELESSMKQELNRLRDDNERLQVEISNVVKLSDELRTSTQLCEDLQTRLEKQERENTDLLNEMRELNEALKGRGDVISRQQAKHQELVTEIKKTSNALAKIEADISAKDAIIKEKESKIHKMSEDNTAALQEVNRLQNISRENESRIKTLSEEISAMRTQFENHETQSDVLSTSTISRTEELARLREVDESFEEKYNKLRSLAVKLKKKAHEQSVRIADLEKQSVDANTKAGETCDRITSLEHERESLQKELKTCKNQIEVLKAEVDKLKSSKKQSNVLTLEIEAFEKSLNETSAKLAAKAAEHDLMRETVQSKETAIEVMKKEIQILEDSKENEKEHSVELKKQIDKLQAQLKDVIHSKQEVSAKLDETESEKQTLQLNLDEVTQRLSSIADERDAEQAKLQSEKENLLQRINSLEDELNGSNSRITIAERTFKDLYQEYSNYKLKAQSVLRQNQTKESSKERELEEELTLLKGENKDLLTRLQTFTDKLQASEKSMEELQEENRCLQNRNSELMNTISDIRQQTDILSQENRKQLETYQETLKSHRLQIEALDSCHLEQVQDLQAKFDREVAQLKISKKKDSEPIAQRPVERVDYFLMEREDAEGSEAEATHTPKYMPSAKRSTHDSVPLDELLSSPTVDSTYAVLQRRLSISPSVELQETKEHLQKQESRVRHLTSLLAESEQDLARLTQLNEMLKEEVRRQERTVEREKHMHNSEYLKNVVLKFVSLNNVDERTRLVPVLNTILKLSPTEMELLQNVAKGKGAADNNNRNWGSFLPHWGTS